MSQSTVNPKQAHHVGGSQNGAITRQKHFTFTVGTWEGGIRP